MNGANNNRREKFLQSYANLPLNTREEIILVLLDEQGKRQPITWAVAYFEIKNETENSEKILTKLDRLGLI